MGRTQLVERICASVEEPFRRSNVLVAYAFGSRISGNPRPDSDLDIGYYLARLGRQEGLGIRAELELAGEISDAVGFEVDLRCLTAASLELRGFVLEEGVRIYSGNGIERVDLERNLLGRYHDYKQTFRRMHEIRIRRVADEGL